MAYSNWYDITDLNLFIESTRVLVYSIFGQTNDDAINVDIKNLNESEKEEMNKCLSNEESMVISKEFLVMDKNTKTYKISDKRYKKFIDALNARLVSNMLQKLSRDGLLESAFDEESNDFIFWVKEDEKNN